MTLELVPFRGHTVPVLSGEISRYNVAELLARIQYSQGYGMGAPMPVTTYGNRPAEPISNSFEGFVLGMLYPDGPVAAAEAYRLRVFGQAQLLYQEMTGGRPGELFDDDRLDRLRAPWPGGTLSDLMKRSLIYGDFAGNAFIVDMDDELVLIRPDWVEIVLEKRAFRGGQVGWRQVGIVYYEGGLNVGDGVPFLPGEYAHFVPGLPDPLASYRGMSWLTPLVREVQADKSAGDHKVAFFENAASPNLAVSLPKEITPSQFEAFVTAMDDKHKGARNAYSTLYTAGGADVTVIGANMQQMDFSSVVGKGETRIANASGISPVLLSFSEGMQGSSLNAGNYVPAKRNTVDTTFRDLWSNFSGSVQQMDAFAPPPAEDGKKTRLWYDGRDIPFLHEDSKDLAEIQQTRAATINSYITAGFTPESATMAVLADDVKLLEHTGLTSVQLLPPGSQDANGDGVPDAEAQASTDYEAALDEFRSELAEWDDEISRAIDDGELNEDEIERRDYYDVRDYRGRFRKVSDRIGHALNEWLKGDGGSDDPLDDFTREQLRLGAKEFGITPRRGASSDELKLALLKDARTRFRAEKGQDQPSHRLTLSSPPHRDQDVGVYQERVKVSPEQIRDVEVENAIRAAYRDALGDGPGRVVSLADIRDRLAEDNIRNAEVELALKRMITQPGVLVIPESNQSALTPRQRSASVRIGGQDKHHLSIADPSPRPMPSGSKISLYRESSTGQRGTRIVSVDSLEALQQWGDDNGEPQVSSWAASERGVPVKKVAPRKAAPADVASIATRLANFDDPPTREDAHALLEPLNKAQLLSVAKGFNIPGASAMSMPALRTGIVEGTVGARRDSRTTRGFGGGRPDEKTPLDRGKVRASDILDDGAFATATLTDSDGFAGDYTFRSIARRQGFDGPPRVVSREQMDQLLADGRPAIFRGVSAGETDDGQMSAAQIQEQLRTGPFAPGTGFYGSGFYFGDNEEDVVEYYTDRTEGSVARAALKSGAHVVDHSMVESEWQQFKADHDTDDFDPLRSAYGSDLGRFAAGRGYDVIRTEDGIYVVLNRTALIVEAPTPAKKAAKKAVPATSATSEYATAIRDGGGEGEIVRLLDADASLTPARLKDLAADLGIDVPTDARSRQRLQSLIAAEASRRFGPGDGRLKDRAPQPATSDKLDPADVAERVGKIDVGGDIAEAQQRIVDALQDVTSTADLRRVASAFNLPLPRDRKFDAAGIRQYIAENIVRDRTRWTISPDPRLSTGKSPAPSPAPSSDLDTQLSTLRAMPTEARRDALDEKKLPELKAMLKAEGLPVSGRKRELVDRLVAKMDGDAPDAAPNPDAPDVEPPVVMADDGGGVGPKGEAPGSNLPPARRAPATPVPIHDLIDSDGATITAALRDVYEGQFGPYTTKVTVYVTRAGTKVDGKGRERKVEPRISVSGKIYNADGSEIGHFERSVGPTDSHYGNGVVRREIWAEHHIVELGGGDEDENPTKYHGKGFGTAFNRRAIDWYRASGVHGISQSDHNGYVWASQGFDFPGGIVPEHKVEELRALVASLRAGGTTDKFGETIPKRLRDAPDLAAQLDAADDLLARLASTQPGEPGYPTAYEISQLGRRAGQRGKTALWLGKYLGVSADEMILNPDEGEVVTP